MSTQSTNDAIMSQPLNVAILLYDQVEELDFCGPYETFKAAGSLAASSRGVDQSAINVFTVAERADPVQTNGGLRVLPDYSFANAPAVDVLVIPGGSTGPQLRNPAMIEWLSGVTQHARINSSVCTGAFLLGTLGLLDGHAATTHWGAIDRLAQTFPQAHVQRDVRWVDEGPLVTAAGVSAGIDMSLHLVERLLGRDVAETTAKYMEYRWNEN